MSDEFATLKPLLDKLEEACNAMDAARVNLTLIPPLDAAVYRRALAKVEMTAQIVTAIYAELRAKAEQSALPELSAETSDYLRQLAQEWQEYERQKSQSED